VPIGSYAYSGSYTYTSTLNLVSVGADSLTRGLVIDHAAFFNDSDQWYSDPSIRRSIFMGDYVIAISDRAVTATALADGSQTAVVRLPGMIYSYYPYMAD
jgi:hypothetical protein